MKKHCIISLLTCTFLFAIASEAQETNTAVQETTNDTLTIDSVTLARMATQSKLAGEIAALSKTTLGTHLVEWTHLAKFKIDRAGVVQQQSFWYSPKKSDNPRAWYSGQEEPIEIFYIDPIANRAATLNLRTLQGTFIPARIAEKAGFMGNSSEILPKNDQSWTQSNQAEMGLKFTSNEPNRRVTIECFTEKDKGFAQACIEWIRLQPIESLALPNEIEKYPIRSLEISDKNGVVLYRLVCEDWIEFDEPMVIDTRELVISDPERDLKTVAKEWAAKKAQAPAEGN
ncbi:MAG: hypothetical protein O2818_07580 [Bacteroidetes bacterium]|nr:hypothetical protein [Bacteroidota bacterium]MDA1336730.1 hypothetical protein [Bacteroidota bacterium]